MAIIDARGESVAAGQARDALTVEQLKSQYKPTDSQALSGIGIRLTVEDNVADVADYVPHVGLIELHFPKFKDGRPFSTAATIRRKYKFEGDLRASGDILPDQVLFLVRSGFSTIVVPRDFTVDAFKSSLVAYSLAFQPGSESHVRLVDELRHAVPKVAAQ